MPTKYKIACDVMTANADKPMSEVAVLISEATGMPVNQSRAYYARAVHLADAPGVIVLEKRGRKLGSKLNKPNTEPDSPNADEAVTIDQINDIMASVLSDIQSEKIRDAA
jgi:hypothetical protein